MLCRSLNWYKLILSYQEQPVGSLLWHPELSLDNWELEQLK